MEGPPLGPGGEDITWPDQVAPRGRKASSTRKIKPQTSNLLTHAISWPKSYNANSTLLTMIHYASAHVWKHKAYNASQITSGVL